MSDFLRDFQASLEDVRLPEALAERYVLVSALGHKPEGGSWLVRRGADGELLVLKMSGGDGEDLREEFRLMERLPEDIQVPRAVEFLEEGGVQYLIRTYLPGKPLDEIWDPGRDPGYERWMEIGGALCALLERLHTLEPPIVHRDIKPENIILSPEGMPGLIDFGIARSYDPARDSDTVHMGTRTTAAPEQYGFAQSDSRTDLFSLGVTLRWMVTGSYSPEALDTADCPGWVKRFLRKAAAFDPADRFPAAAVMGKALKRRSAPRWKRIAAAILALCFVWGGGLFIHSAAQTRAVEFSSPLLEAAVRSELDMAEGPVTRQDLERVQRLAVVGQTLLGEEQDFQCQLCVYVDGAAQFDAPRGDISDLALLADMPNLTTLYLCCQEISDLSPLAGLPLRELYLCDNAVSDLSPLEQLPELEVLYLGSNPLDDFTPLASLKNLRRLNLDFWEWLEPESLEPLDGLNLEYLSLGNLYPKDGDWSFLGTLERLHTLWLWDPPWMAVEGLEGCNSLRVLNLGNYQMPDLMDLPVLPHLISLATFNILPSIEGIQKQAGIRWLSLCNQEDVDLTPAAALPALEELYIFNVSTPSFGPLLEAPSLKRVDVDTEETRAAVEADCPGHRFEITGK